MNNALRALLCMLVAALPAIAQDAAKVSELEGSGQFREAAHLLRRALDAEPSPAGRKAIAFELDRLERIKLDYSLTRRALLAQLMNSVRDMKETELDRWIAEGRLDRRTIDGEQKFVGVSRSNLFWRYPDIASRRIDPPDNSTFARAVWNNVREITAASLREGKPYVLPKRFNVTMKVTARKDAVPAGETVRAWLPIPRTFPFQKNFRLLEAVPTALKVDDPSSRIRSVYMEGRAEAGAPTAFRIAYEYTHYGIRFSLEPGKVLPYDPVDPAVKEFTREGPHVVFTEKIRALSDSLAGDEPNPLLKAKRFYDWIASNIRYSYALEYSTIRNISDYCLTNMYGDCGQEALLLITLCRLNGIPARWQSGWFTFPGGKTIHDWTEVYVPPYGWFPVDPYMGIFAMQYVPGLDDQQRREVRDFYFGGLDQYRMSANSDHNQTLNPAKQSFRSDNVDFQRGELEFGTTNVYFDKYSFRLDIEEIEPVP